MAFHDPTKRKWALAFILIRLFGIPFIAFSIAFSLVNPVVGIVLILGVAVGSGIAFRILAEVGTRSLVSYTIYVLVALGLVVLWFASIISIYEGVIIFAPITVAYWILSWYEK